MKISEKQISFINKSEWVILGTSSKDGVPRVAIVVPEEVGGDSITLADCEMNVSNGNIMENPNVFISSYDKGDMDRWIKINGRARYVTSGKMLEKIKAAAAAENSPYRPKALIEVEVLEVSEQGLK